MVSRLGEQEPLAAHPNCWEHLADNFTASGLLNRTRTVSAYIGPFSDEPNDPNVCKLQNGKRHKAQLKHPNY